MTKQWLLAEFTQGKSLEQIGRETGRHPSTVAYWAKKHGLASPGAERFAARGAPERQVVEVLAARGATLAEMADALDRSAATVRHWLKRWDIQRAPRPGRAPADPATAPAIEELECRHHGLTAFRLEGRGYYRCMRCRMERVSEWRRRVKRRLIEEAGGHCRLCGYDRCPAALQFHHLDPSQKTFALSREGVTRSFEEVRSEARKCALLCANCHAEVEAGYSRLASTSP